MLNQKKGIMFTVVSVLVCALIITAFFSFQSVSLDSDVENTKIRIKSIDRFATDTDAYVSALVYATGKETLEFTTSLMIGNNSFLNNYTGEFARCMMEGNISVPWSAVQLKCPPKTYLGLEFGAFQTFSNENLNLDSKITLNGVQIVQEEAFNVIIYTNYTVIINDSYAFWNETRIAKTRIGIAGLRDPTYSIINTSDNKNIELYPIKESNHTINVTYRSPDTWTEKPSIAHKTVMNGTYFEWRGAPSYLERLEGIKNASNPNNFSGSNGQTCVTGVGRCGIVSIIPASRMSYYAYGHESMMNSKIRSHVDFEFWNNKPVDYFYRRYDFWKVYYDYNDDRGQMEIFSQTASNGLNGSVVPNSLIEAINMTDEGYLVSLN